MILISNAIGREVKVIDIPLEAAMESFKSWGLGPVSLSRFQSMLEASIDGYYSEPTDVVKEISGHDPRSIEDFVKENADAWR